MDLNCAYNCYNSKIPHNTLSMFSIKNESPNKTYSSSNVKTLKRNLNNQEKTWSKLLCIPIQSYPIDDCEKSKHTFSNEKVKRIKQQMKLQRDNNYTAKASNCKNQMYK